MAAAVASVREAADEVLVVDGGSSDRTRSVAAESGARVIESLRGRGLQLHRGARETTGDWLALSSARRWQRDGPVLTTLCNDALIVLLLAGVSPRHLARFCRAEPAPAKGS